MPTNAVTSLPELSAFTRESESEVTARLVEVALVVVAFVAVKLCRVVEPVTSMLPPILAKVVLGSNQNSAEVVELAPMATISSSLFG